MIDSSNGTVAPVSSKATTTDEPVTGSITIDVCVGRFDEPPDPPAGVDPLGVVVPAPLDPDGGTVVVALAFGSVVVAAGGAASLPTRHCSHGGAPGILAIDALAMSTNGADSRA
jgi:hypothetical protein